MPEISIKFTKKFTLGAKLYLLFQGTFAYWASFPVPRLRSYTRSLVGNRGDYMLYDVVLRWPEHFSVNTALSDFPP
jgi:hypothetical protein